MSTFAVIEAPSPLGLVAGGVEQLPKALLGAGLAEAIGAQLAGEVAVPSRSGEARRSSHTSMASVRSWGTPTSCSSVVATPT